MATRPRYKPGFTAARLIEHFKQHPNAEHSRDELAKILKVSKYCIYTAVYKLLEEGYLENRRTVRRYSK